MTGITPKEFIDNNPLRLLITPAYADEIEQVLRDLQQHLKFEFEKDIRPNGNYEFIISATDADFSSTYYRLGINMMNEYAHNLNMVFANLENILL